MREEIKRIMQHVDNVHVTRRRCMRTFVVFDVSMFVNKQSGVLEVISQAFRDYKANTGLAMVVDGSTTSEENE